MSAVYVYALQDRAGRRRSLLGHVIEIIPVEGIYAAVERRSAAPRMSEASLRVQHQIVVELGRAADAILPARFGALVESKELQRVVRLRQGILQESLERVRSREQMTVRIFGPSRRPSVAGSRKARSGTEYLARRRSSLTPPPTAALVSRAVRGLVSAEEIDGARGGIQATLNHLVSRGCAAEYRALVREAVADMEARVRVTVSGPSPPFAFVPDLWMSG
jgi:Gas vesicle synthesis protein GvpL/GvpF